MLFRSHPHMTRSRINFLSSAVSDTIHGIDQLQVTSFRDAAILDQKAANPGSHSIRGPTSDHIKHIVEYPYNRKPLQTEAKASLNRSARNQNEEEKMHPRSSTPVHHSPHIVETLSPSVIQRYNTPGPKGEQPWILVTGASDGIGKE